MARLSIVIASLTLVLGSSLLWAAPNAPRNFRIIAPECASLALSATSASLPAAGGTGSIGVTSNSTCQWSVSSAVSWIALTSGASGQGNGTVNYSVSANPNSNPQTGTLSIAHKAFTITQAGNTVTTGPWAKRFGGSETESAAAVAIDSDGNYIVAGMFDGNFNFGGFPLIHTGNLYTRDIFIAKVKSSDGTVLWARGYGGVADEHVLTMVLDGTNHIYLGGRFIGGSANFGGGTVAKIGNQDAFLAKYLPDGTFVWVKTFGGTNPFNDRNDISVTSIDLDLTQQNVVVTGSFAGQGNFGGATLNSAGTDTFLAKYKRDGTHVFSKNFINGDADSGVKVLVDKSNGNGDIFLIGLFRFAINFNTTAAPVELRASGPSAVRVILNDIYICKLSSMGEWSSGSSWANRYGGTGVDEPRDAALDSHGGLVIAGVFGYWSTGPTDLGGGPIPTADLANNMFVARYSTLDGRVGTGGWVRPWLCPKEGSPRAVAVDSDGNVIFTGGFNGTCTSDGQSLIYREKSPDSIAMDIFAVKYSGAGTRLWTKSPGGLDDESSAGATIDRGKSPVLVGSFFGAADFGNTRLTPAGTGGTADAFVLKISGDGTLP